MKPTSYKLLLALTAGLLASAAHGAGTGKTGHRSLTVTATAYTSLRSETDKNPHTAAWGDRLQAGMHAIAVSPDLLKKGLVRGTHVRIHGLRGEYVVLDKMPRRWKNRIDIYMGYDVKTARKWGKRRVVIEWKK